jgi:SAM-dependent methyltransferase
LKTKFDYVKETRLAYRNCARAETYKKQHTKALSWAHLTMWRECFCVEKALKQCNLKKYDKLLDMPCGTGILAAVLEKFPSLVIAADISRQMMRLAREEYRGKNFRGFIQADITNAPFRCETYDCVIVLGFMHRVPATIREQTLREITLLSKRFIIVSYSIDSPPQRLKQSLTRTIRPTHQSAPSPIRLRDISEEFNSLGLTVRKRFRVACFFSAEIVFLLEKNL